jgi:hypothetical protein
MKTFRMASSSNRWDEHDVEVSNSRAGLERAGEHSRFPQRNRAKGSAGT